ncbi:Bifunctional adenosylcobalamin biosynthesis protein [Rhodovastum atsumiense]|uniref:Bifunctional adenosylcobalamin biosynthesis protein n=1 Tax=Rhodovastum atsumiense TaxID=504468 RepID=A0A5M6IXZ3_9PROT|nr:bifunctional adenosylcobinamide kinase/adenosylcobinamide-phosphate guanylyltransferase [Rhodovastum atsumiense]KAA5612829.1 bifunctional adenosylcobinamide kinase/adenosylcobinamide-phosphate guanylyltransferase [Rhodovastum atsumiense]CAH2601106.1 Bifunctional adenosylcobalamin biosynthesis protein [Rhodovastum atsumiense]
MGELVFLTGPVRSGKSARAVEIAKGWGDDVVFVATYRADPADAEMAERVRRHRAERPAGWRTLEAPQDVAAALAGLTPVPSGVLLDSIVLWAAARFEQDDAAILAEWDALLRALRAAPFPALIVGDEIGWSPVPMDAALRRFRDLAGWLGQRTAAAATEAWLMVAGCPVRLK